MVTATKTEPKNGTKLSARNGKSKGITMAKSSKPSKLDVKPAAGRAEALDRALSQIERA